MPVFNGPPPNPGELGMTSEEKALRGRPKAVIYFQPSHGAAAREFAAMVRNSKTEDSQPPLTVLCDISRWDGRELEDAQVVFIMRGFRDAQLTKTYQRNMPACEIFYLNTEGGVLDDRPEEIAPRVNPFAAVTEKARATRVDATDVPPHSSAGSPAEGHGPNADPASLGARPLPIDDEREADSQPSGSGAEGTAVGNDAGGGEASHRRTRRPRNQPPSDSGGSEGGPFTA